MSDDVWGPWVDHDGMGCPCEGQYVQVECADGELTEGVAGSKCRSEGVNVHRGFLSAWYWPNGTAEGKRIVRYRIRKPRGLAILQELIENLPAPVREREGA